MAVHYHVQPINDGAKAHVRDKSQE